MNKIKNLFMEEITFRIACEIESSNGKKFLAQDNFHFSGK